MANYTLDLLSKAGPRPAMDYLLPRISARSNITYGEIAERLSRDLGINAKIFPTHIGYVAGSLQDIIHDVDPNAPLLNALVVRGDSDEAGSGVDGYLKQKYRLKGTEIDPSLKSKLLQKAAKEVYAFKHWNKIYRKVFKKRPPSSAPFRVINGSERDGQTRGGPAESEEHKRLKAYVLAHPAKVGIRGRLVEGKDEYCLLSGDEVDVFFAKDDEYWLVEVKSEVSNERDLIRGCYQCIKYRAVFEAQCRRTLPEARIHAVLVTTSELSAAAKAIANDHDINHFVIRESIL